MKDADAPISQQVTSLRLTPPGHIGFLLFILVFSLSIGKAPIFADPDTAWHIAAGDLIRLNHIIPPHDPWSYTAPFERWYNLSWLFDIFLSWLYDWGDFPAIYVFTIAIFALSIAAMAQHSVLRGANRVAVFMASMLTLYTVFVGVLARPNLCSIPLTLLFYHLLHRHRATGKLFYLVPLPFLMALWVNLHGGFLLAFVLMGLFFAEAAWDRDRARARAIGGAFAACLAATLINPYGYDIYYGAYKSVAGYFDKTYINEWRPVEIGHYPPMTLFLILMLCITNIRDREIPLIDRWLAVALTILALSSIRHSIVVAMLLMPFVSLRLSHFFAEGRFAKRMKAWDAALTRDMQEPAIRTFAAVLAGIAFLFISTPFPRDKVVGDVMGFPDKDFPGLEAIYIEEHFPYQHFFNDYNIGGYLDFLWRGRMKVFVDGRASSVFSDELLEDYATFMDARGYGPRAARIARQYHIDGLILSNDLKDAGDWHWNPEWRVMYQGKVATVYIRREIAEKIDTFMAEREKKRARQSSHPKQTQIPSVSSTR